MKQIDYVFSKVDSLVEVPYVQTTFFGSLNVKSMIPRSHGIQMNDMNNIMCYRNYDICCVYAIMCCVQNVKYYDACYYHGITFLIQIWCVLEYTHTKFKFLLTLFNYKLLGADTS